MSSVFPLRALCALALLTGGPALRAQFGGLDKLKRAIDKPADTIKQKMPEPAKTAMDHAPDAAKVLKALEGIGPEEERLIGESVALEVVGKYGGVWRDETATRRVNLLGRALAYYSSRPVLDWRFAVLDSPAINGFSAPGGLVFITRGLYELAADDDALAAILAHEIAHVTQRHALKIIGRAEFVTGTTNILVKTNAAAAEAQAASFRLFDTGIADIVKTLLDQGFDPPTEFAADKLGRELAVTAGYAPGGLRRVLVQLQAGKTEPKQTFSTHPPLADRIKKLPADPAAP